MAAEATIGGAAALLEAAAAEARRFERALRDPARAQQALLAQIIAANAASDFGRAHKFAAATDLAGFRARVPIRDHAALRPWIDRIAAGESGVLTTAPVIAFEETGGTASGGKLVPYTAEGLAGFRRAVLPWLDDLARRRPAAFAGRAYVTVSPATRAPRSTPGGVPIGLHSDAAYLGEELAPAFAAMLAVPPALGRITEPAQWQVATLAALVEAPDLSLVSLWSPTFMLALLGALEPLAEAISARLSPPARARLSRALAGPEPDTQALWPRLDCISCWSDGASAAFARRLGDRFGHAAIEPKGLLATEAAVTLPWGGACLPALGSGFIELIGDDGEPRLIGEVRPGATYRVIVTTQSGLYRYDLGDHVECTALVGGLPALRFIGRGGTTSDLVGEKLEDRFVAPILQDLPCPALLAAFTDPPGYGVIAADPLDAADLARIEARLCANPLYAQARRLGQLAPLRHRHRPGLAQELTMCAMARGARMGDVKPVALAGGGGDDWPCP